MQALARDGVNRCYPPAAKVEAAVKAGADGTCKLVLTTIDAGRRARDKAHEEAEEAANRRWQRRRRASPPS